MLSANQAESLMSKLAYSIEGIRSCEWNSEMMEVVIEPVSLESYGEIAATVEAMIAEERGIRTLGSRTIKQTPVRSDILERGFDDGREATLQQAYATDGSVKRDDAVKLIGLLDQLFEVMAVRRGAALRRYPSMIGLDTLEKCGYIRSFPQNLYMVSEFSHQYDTLRQVKTAVDPAALARQSKHALAPAVCFHCYAELSGQVLDGPVRLTAMGNCFRHEAEWRVGNHRLTEFSMREVVFVGDSDFVEEERGWWMQEIWSLFVELDLHGSLTTANDPFYFSEDALKIQHQKMASMKYELLVETPAGSTFSIASFNHMGDSLCKPFNVNGPAGLPWSSGCVAFGIDRWAFALLAEYGAWDEWPSIVKDRFQGRALASVMQV